MGLESKISEKGTWLLIKSGKILGPFEPSQIQEWLISEVITFDHDLIPNFGFPFKVRDHEMLLRYFPELKSIAHNENTKTLFITRTHQISFPSRYASWIFLCLGFLIGMSLLALMVLHTSV